MVVGALVSAPFHQHEMRWIFDGQAAEQEAVHDAEDGGVDADGNGEREDRDHGRAELAAQQARREANILCRSANEMCRWA